MTIHLSGLGIHHNSHLFGPKAPGAQFAKPKACNQFIPKVVRFKSWVFFPQEIFGLEIHNWQGNFDLPKGCCFFAVIALEANVQQSQQDCKHPQGWGPTLRSRNWWVSSQWYWCYRFVSSWYQLPENKPWEVCEACLVTWWPLLLTLGFSNFRADMLKRHLVSQGLNLGEDYPKQHGIWIYDVKVCQGGILEYVQWNVAEISDTLVFLAVFIVSKIRMGWFSLFFSDLCTDLFVTCSSRLHVFKFHLYIGILFKRDFHTKIAGFLESKASLVHPFTVYTSRSISISLCDCYFTMPSLHKTCRLDLQWYWYHLDIWGFEPQKHATSPENLIP